MPRSVARKTAQKVAVRTAQKKEGKAHTFSIPDWRDAEAYPKDPLSNIHPEFAEYIESRKNCPFDEDILRRCLWRWEFLRRMEEYREDWLKYKNQSLKEVEKYGLMFGGFPDPSEARPFPLFFDEMFGAVSTHGFISKICIDLARPIKPQIQWIEKKALWAQKNTLPELLKLPKSGINTDALRYNLKPGEKEWPLLLRVLDARESQATYQTIGNHLFDGESYSESASMAKKKHDAAIRIQKILTRPNPFIDALGLPI